MTTITPRCPGITTDPPGADVAPLCMQCLRRTAPWVHPRVTMMLPTSEALDNDTCKEKIEP